MSRWGILACCAALFPSVLLANEPAIRQLEFEVSVIHVRSTEPVPAEQRSSTGSALQELIGVWRQSGKIERMTTMRVSALEQQKALVQIGESVPVVVGRMAAPGGRAAGPGGFGPTSTSYQMEQHGTMLECMGHVAAGDVIEVQISVEQTRPGRPAASTAAKPAGGSADAAPPADAPNPGRTTSQAKTTVSAKSGEVKVIGAAWNETAEGTSATLILLTPRQISSSAAK